MIEHARFWFPSGFHPIPVRTVGAGSGIGDPYMLVLFSSFLLSHQCPCPLARILFSVLEGVNLNSRSFFSFSVSLVGGGGEPEFALLADSLLARSDWYQDILSARAERTLAIEAKRASSSLLGLVVLGVVVVAVVEDMRDCGAPTRGRIWWFAR